MFIIVVVAIVVFLTIFALQNAAPVAIAFLFWKFEASIAILILLCVLAGVIIGMILFALLKLKLSSDSTY